MKIRRITKFNISIFDSVLKLLPQLAPDVTLPLKETFKSILKSDNTFLFVGELENKQIVGMLTIVTYGLLSGNKFWIEDVVVDESQRGKGFGRDLIMHAISFSQNMGAESLMLTSRPARIAANKLYTDLGFVKYETNVYKYSYANRKY